MLPEMTAGEIGDILDHVLDLAVEDFQTVYAADRASFTIRDQARTSLRLSAADLGWVDKRVRGVMRSLYASREWPNAGMKLAAHGAVMRMVQAVARRDRLTREQYDAFVDGFRRVGVRVPPHPSEVDG